MTSGLIGHSPCRPRAGTSTSGAKAPFSREPIERRCAQRFGRPSWHHEHSPHVEKYVSLTTRSPATTQDSLPAAGQALPGGPVYPLGSFAEFRSLCLLSAQALPGAQ